MNIESGPLTIEWEPFAPLDHSKQVTILPRDGSTIKIQIGRTMKIQHGCTIKIQRGRTFKNPTWPSIPRMLYEKGQWGCLATRANH